MKRIDMYRVSALIGSAVFVLAGVAEAAGLGAVEIRAHEGSAAGEAFGDPVADAGDVDGDGVRDYVVGVPSFDGLPGADSGRAVVYSGANGATLHTLDGGAAGGRFGASVAGGGDVDGDGRDDVAVGEPGTFPAHAYVFSGFDGSPIHTFTGNSLCLFQNCFFVDCSTGGSPYFDDFGGSVAIVGDADGDVFDDVLVGASLSNRDCSPIDGLIAVKGGARLFSGATGAQIRAHVGSAFCDFGFQICRGENLGETVAGAGDLDGDARADYLVSGPNFVNAIFFPSILGRVHAYGGAAGAELHFVDGPGAVSPFDPTPGRFGVSLASVGDVDSDGVPDYLIRQRQNGAFVGKIYMRSGADGSAIHTTDVPDNSSAAAAGDADGDGDADFLVGVTTFDGGAGADTGAVEVRDAATGAPCATIEGTQADERLGGSVAGLGDVDGDGHADVAAGSTGFDGAAGVDAGKVTIFGLVPPGGCSVAAAGRGGPGPGASALYLAALGALVVVRRPTGARGGPPRADRGHRKGHAFLIFTSPLAGEVGETQSSRVRGPWAVARAGHFPSP